MSYEFLLDLNTIDAPSPTDKLIPAGTLAKVTMAIKPGGHGPDNWLTQSANTGSVYLNTEFTIVEGPYARRKIFQCIGVQGANPHGDKDDKWGQNGRSLLRSLWESAHRIHPQDQSDKAQQARKMRSLSELNSMTCVVRIGVENDKSGQYQPQNKVVSAVTIDHKAYGELMGSSLPPTYSHAGMPGWTVR